MYITWTVFLCTAGLDAGGIGEHRESRYTVERTRVVNFIKLGGGDMLCIQYIEQKDCTLYSWVRCRRYMRDSLYKT